MDLSRVKLGAIWTIFLIVISWWQSKKTYFIVSLQLHKQYICQFFQFVVAIDVIIQMTHSPGGTKTNIYIRRSLEVPMAMALKIFSMMANAFRLEKNYI